jgi:hypothetical protein
LDVFKKFGDSNSGIGKTGDWKLKCVQDNIGLQEVQKLLESYDLTNTERSLTNTTSSTKSLIYVIIINKDDQELIATVGDLEFSDHLVQILRINSGIGNMRYKLVKKNS